MDSEVAAVSRDHCTQRPLDVEPGQPTALRGNQQHRFEHPRQAGLADLRSQPAGLLFEIGVAVGRDDGQHRPLVAAGGGEAALCQEEVPGNESCDREANRLDCRSSYHLPQTTTADSQE